MIHNYLIRRRESLLPWVEDWTSPQDHVRHEKNVNNLTYEEWFWCHPSAYRLIQFGIYVLGFITYTVAGLYLYQYSLWLASINGVLAVVMVVLFFKKKIELKHIKDFTFYDMYLRDFEVKVE